MVYCISSDEEMRSALVDFDYDRRAARFTTERLREISAKDFGLDYALVRLRRAVDRPVLRLASPRQLTAQQALVIIQHPSGEPKQVSVRGCRVGQVQVVGRDENAAPTDFAHECDAAATGTR